MSGRKGRPMRRYDKDIFQREAAAKERSERAAFDRGEYEADPEKWPCPDGRFCEYGCKS